MKHTHERLMELLHLGREFSLADLRRELGVQSNKQAKRVIDKLREAGVPIDEENRKRKKYFFIPDYKRRITTKHTLQFSEEEVQSLAVAVQAAQYVLAPTPLIGPLQTAFSMLLAVLSEQAISFDLSEAQRHWHFRNAPTIPLDHIVFNRLREAIIEQRSVRFDYITASTGKVSENRKVDPYSLALCGTTWMLVGYCHQRQKPIDFAIADISNVRLCDPKEETQAYFEIPKNFDLDLHFRDRFNALASGEPYTISLLVEKDRAQYFRRKLYHPTQQIEQEDESGRIVVSYEVNGLKEIRSFVQGWGVGITVKEPRELIAIIKEEIEILHTRYE